MGPEDLGHVAITGMAGRFPGAGDVETFWGNLADGVESISALTEQELLDSGVAPELLRQDNYVRAKGVLEGGDLFDASFFGYSPREAEVMDPQHRVFLECAWQALESAGYDPRTFEGRIGVFAGSSMNSYLLFNVMANRSTYEATGGYQTLLASDKDFLATRASYKFGLRGPSMTVQTACSTSLTAVHLACQSLLNGECDIALAGGVSVSVPLSSGYVHEQGGILSADGHCRAFDAEAGGTVAGNGVGVVVLRKLAEAQSAGDTVEAVIRGTAVNNDGSLKAGYTAPSVTGQAEVISEALALAEVDASTIGYVEAHGTGTALGDPIEIAALTRAYREYTDATGYCRIGSVKSNVGHLDAAAGVTALIKATLALKHKAFPATLNFRAPNPELALDSSPFVVGTELTEWPEGPTPRRAGVSAFGIGGTNAHVVLEEAPPARPAGAQGRAVTVLPLSARGPAALAARAAELADRLEQRPELDLNDTAFTLACRRTAFETRTAVVAHGREASVAALRAIGERDAVSAADQAPVAFLFPGQGAQYVGMARDLYAHEPVFARALDRCAELFAGQLGEDLRTLLFAEDGKQADASRRLGETAITQPALFTVEYALAKLWESWGVRPRAMAGHSVGEYVAAHLAGVFSLEDAVRLVAARGLLVQGMPRGAMLSVFLPEDEASALLDERLCLAAVNSTGLCVVSGPTEAVEELEQRLKSDAVACRRLHTSHAFHSPSMEGAVEPFVELVREVTLNAPQVPLCSNVTGTWMTAEQATSPEYWGAHLRGTVRFGDILRDLLLDPDLVLLEVGPGRTLGDFARAHADARPERTVLDSLRHPKEERDDRAYLLQRLGELWSAGATVDWPGFHAAEDRRVVRLPGYPFQRQRFWTEPDAVQGESALPAAVAGPLDDWFSAPGWRRLAPLTRPVTGTAPDSGDVWLILGAELALGSALADALAADGARVVRVSAEDTGTDGVRHIDLTDRAHYADLLTGLDLAPGTTLRIVHLWSLLGEPVAALDADALAAAARLGFDSLLALAQGIGDARTGCPAHLDVLCRGIRAVTGDEELQPENAPLTGATTVIPQEVTDVTCRTLDLSGLSGTGNGPVPAATVRAVRTLLGTDTEERDLALRGRHWWVRDFDAVKLGAETQDAPTQLRDGGVYLVTGGLGGVGLALAERIAADAEAPVLGLLGRSEFPAEDAWADWLAAHDDQDPTSARIRRLSALRERGAQVVVLQADVTDRQEMAEAVAALGAHGPLRGVVHAAGLPSNGMISGKSPADAAQVMAAKTLGTLVLEQVCPREDLDFVLLCSSLTSVLGGPGQSDYCGANAFLEVYAQSRRTTLDLPVTAVSWDTWQGVGMAAGLVARFGGEDGRGTETAHPLLRLLESGENSRTYVTTFSTAENWIVDEHRIMDHGLVPGTTYLELVRAAVAEQAKGHEIELRDVLFMLPVVVPDGQTRQVFTTVEQHDGHWRFTVRSRAAAGSGAAWQDHATGSVVLHDPAPEVRHDLAEVLGRIDVTEDLLSEEEIHHRLKLDKAAQGGPMTFSFGTRWRCLRRIQAGGDRLLVTLELPEECHEDLDGYVLHPALLDVAGASARIHAQDVYYLPFTYRSLRVAASLTGTVHCFVQLKESADASGETLTCDVELLDPEGRSLVTISDFTIKRINDVEGLLDQVAQAAAPPPEETEREEGGVLRALAQGISEQDGATAFARLLSAGDLPEHVVVSARDLGAMRRLAARITPELLAREAESLAPAGGTHARPDLATAYEAPGTPEEVAVAEVWQEVLGIDRVGVDDDFFALGGHSLAAVQIGAKIQSRFGTELDLRDFFDSPTVRGTVALLAAGGKRAVDPEDAITAIDRDAPGAALDAESEDMENAEDLDGLSEDELDARLLELLAESESESEDDEDEGEEEDDTDDTAGADDADGAADFPNPEGNLA
ncbi:SDR family NAD(P)-dependent oxidoreductase [Streptomyces sp. NA04227]|nr:SDR family NAD(P)-dependent oxidoreductase [Streptomyces sp. NA04227]